MTHQHSSSSLNCNLIDLSVPVPKLNLIYMLEKELGKISDEIIKALCIKLYPVQNSNANPYNSLYKQLISYFNLQFAKGNNYENTVN
jgi:hypothetical protein